MYTGRRNGKYAELMQRLDKTLKEQHFAFVFTKQELKERDQELVKEVCEKIKEQLGFIVDGQERIVCDGSATGDKTILAVLNQIQKEFEK